MRTRNVLGAAVLGITTAFLVAPSAVAADSYYAAIGIQDHEIKAGAEIMVVASCQVPGFTSSNVVSSVLDSPPLRRQAGQDDHSVMFADAHVKPGTKPGKYSLSFTCNGKKVSNTFEVVGPKQAKPKPAGTKAPAQVAVKPKGAPQTGGGPGA